MSPAKNLPLVSKKFTRIYPPYPRHFPTLIGSESVAVKSHAAENHQLVNIPVNREYGCPSYPTTPNARYEIGHGNLKMQ